MQNPLLVFDFDGVICNSIYDSFKTAINTYLDLLPKNNLPFNGPIESLESIFAFEKSNPEFFNAFRNLMPFGNRAEDYYIILQILEQDRANQIQTQKQYHEFETVLEPSMLNAYGKAFYALRYSCQKKNVKTWSELSPAFPGVIEAVRQLTQRFQLAIATSKDLASIHILLKTYGLTDCFKSESILDKDIANSKKHHLELLQKMYQLPFDQISFIDDKLLHLESVADLGIQCYLATWGFNTPREYQNAITNGFHLLKLEDLSSLGQQTN